MSKQQKADTVQAAIYLVMLYLSSQDTEQIHPAWLLGLFPCLVILIFEDDTKWFKATEGVLTLSVLMSWAILPFFGLSGPEVAWWLMFLLFCWNGADAIKFIVNNLHLGKGSVVEAVKEGGRHDSEASTKKTGKPFQTVKPPPPAKPMGTGDKEEKPRPEPPENSKDQ